MPAVALLLSSGGVKPSSVERVICGGGPGSFTSLRIAGSIAKGIATGASAELWSVPSLGLIVAGAAPPLAAGRYLAVLDALREEAYVALYEVQPGLGEGGNDSTISQLEPAHLLPLQDVKRTAAGLSATILGDEQPGRPAESPRKPLHAPHARGALRLLDEAAGGGRVDVASWEPLYGRLAEAQVRWEASHGRPLPLG